MSNLQLYLMIWYKIILWHEHAKKWVVLKGKKMKVSSTRQPVRVYIHSLLL